MYTGPNIRRLAGSVTLMAITAGGYVAFAPAADAATGPTATLSNGTVTITGTPDRDVISASITCQAGDVEVPTYRTLPARTRSSRAPSVSSSGTSMSGRWDW